MNSVQLIKKEIVRETFYRKGQILEISKGFYIETRRDLEGKKKQSEISEIILDHYSRCS